MTKIDGNRMFDLVLKYTPNGDQPQAIEELVSGIKSGKKRASFTWRNGNR